MLVRRNVCDAFRQRDREGVHTIPSLADFHGTARPTPARAGRTKEALARRLAGTWLCGDTRRCIGDLAKRHARRHE